MRGGNEPGPHEPGGGAPDDGTGQPAGDGGPVGPFPSWRWLYGTVLVWFVLVVAALCVFTSVTDYGGP